MTDRELLKEARDLIVMCSLLDKSGQCEAMADKIDKQLSIANVVGQSEQLPLSKCCNKEMKSMRYCTNCQEWEGGNWLQLADILNNYYQKCV